MGFSDIKYDFVGRLENFAKDIDVVLRAMGLSAGEGDLFKQRVRNESEKVYILSNSQKRRVSQIFAVDYDNFGYS